MRSGLTVSNSHGVTFCQPHNFEQGPVLSTGGRRLGKETIREETQFMEVELPLKVLLLKERPLRIYEGQNTFRGTCT